jgi:hypothetical protein
MIEDPDRDPVAVLLRWQQAGGVWRVLARRAEAVTVALCQCDGGEEVDRFASADPRLRDYLGARTTSED